MSDELEEIKKTAELAGISLIGITEDKNSTLQSLNTMVFELSAILATYTKRTGNIEMHSEVDFPKSYLEGLKQADALRFAQRIFKLLNDNLIDLLGYGVEQTHIDELKIIVDAFSEALPVTQLSKAEHKAATEKLDKQITATDEKLKTQLDNMTISFQRKNPDFYNAYWNARQVTMYGVRHTKDETPKEEKVA